MNELKKAKVYTRTGDTGTTSLVGGQRVEKHHSRIEAYGTLDELNSAIGLIAAHPDTRPSDRTYLTTLQSHLFDIGSYLACPPEGNFTLPSGVTPQRLQEMEHQIDTLDKALPKLDRFILPGGSYLSALCHMARTICRRAERRITALDTHHAIEPQVLAYVNRLSDYLFTLARFNNIFADQPEIFWEKDC